MRRKHPPDAHSRWIPRCEDGGRQRRNGGVGVGAALRSVRRAASARRVPLIGLAAAFVFAAQMLNFPVAGGTSGHLIGAVLVAVLLGPSAAVLAITAVLVVQCFMFADGGVTALGANVFNMAIVAPGVGYALYALVRRAAGDSLRARLLAIAFAAWCSTVVAAIVCAGQLALSGTVAWQRGFSRHGRDPHADRSRRSRDHHARRGGGGPGAPRTAGGAAGRVPLHPAMRP